MVLILGGFKNWYYHNIQFELELLYSYIQRIEQQVAYGIEDFNKKREFITLYEDAENNYIECVEIYDGIDNSTFDLDGIFKEYFPNLQRKSAFITLYSFFENELDILCVKFRDFKNIKIDLKDISGNGVDRSCNYLEKVANISVDKSSIEWNRIKDIQKIRNLIVHSNGNLKDINGKIREEEVKIINKNQYLDSKSGLYINEGFLKYVLDTFDEYFKLINNSIQETYK